MRNNHNLLIFQFGLAVLAVGMLVGLTWGNYSFAEKNPGGNDFLTHWMGTRAIIKDGVSPYSDDIAKKIQDIAYGRPAEPGENKMTFVYPLYSVVFFAPFALIDDFIMARAVWMTVLEVSLVLMAIFSIRLVQWKVGPIMVAFLLLFSIFWYHGLRPLINGNAIILVGMLVTGALLAMKNKMDELAGVLLAFSTIKPQIVFLLCLFVFLWALSKHRYRLVGWMVGTVGLLTLSAALLIPDWLAQNFLVIFNYPSYNPPGTPGAVFAVWWPAWGARVGLALTILVLLLLAFEWRRAMQRGFRGFLWTACLTLVLGPWSGIQTDPGNFVVMYPAIILVLSILEGRWARFGKILAAVGLFLLTIGIWWIFLSTVTYGGQPQQSPVMFFPLPALTLVGMYWIRWWFVRPPSVWFDAIYAEENP